MLVHFHELVEVCSVVFCIWDDLFPLAILILPLNKIELSTEFDSFKARVCQFIEVILEVQVLLTGFRTVWEIRHVLFLVGKELVHILALLVKLECVLNLCRLMILKCLRQSVHVEIIHRLQHLLHAVDDIFEGTLDVRLLLFLVHPKLIQVQSVESLEAASCVFTLGFS